MAKSGDKKKQQHGEDQGKVAITAASRYEALSSSRSSYLERARQCSKLTLPSLLPEDDSGGKVSDAPFKTPFQGIGAEGVSTLAARILLTMFPPNMPMFRMTLNDDKLRETREKASQTMEATKEQQAWETEVQTALSKYEQAVQADIEASGDRPTIHESLLHLIIAGNGLLYDSHDVGQGMRFFPLSRYVVNRDPIGRWMEMVIHEKASLKALPVEEQQRIITAMNGGGGDGSTEITDETLVDLYTHVTRDGDKCYSYQECGGQRIEGTDGEYPVDGCPFIPLRMYWVAGEDYGRSYVENYLGDLKSLEALTQAIIEGSAISAKVVFLVQPNGTTKAVDLQRAPNGGFITGNAQDVTALQVQKAADLRVALETMQIIQQRLAKAFMLMDGIRRDAERVTAEEIRAMASELEASLGGIYSMLAQEYQLPYAKRRIFRLTKASKLPALPKDTALPTIITGFEALGRGNDKQKLTSFLTTIASIFGPQAVQQYVNVPDGLSRLAAADGINTEGLIKTPEQIQQEQQEAQQMQMAQQLGPEAMKMMMAGNTSAQQQQQPQQQQEGTM